MGRRGVRRTLLGLVGLGLLRDGNFNEWEPTSFQSPYDSSVVAFRCPRCRGVWRADVPSLACFGRANQPHMPVLMDVVDLEDAPSNTADLRVDTVE